MTKEARKKRLKRPVEKSTFEQHLESQLGFLRSSMASYDNGNRDEFVRLATTLRVLFHDTRNSTSLVVHLDWQDLDLISYSYPLNPRNLLSESPLTLWHVSDSGVDIQPVLNNGPSRRSKVKIDQWKNEKVIRDTFRSEFSRWDIVCTVADQIGGAHVDGSIEEWFAQLSEDNSMGFIFGNEGGGGFLGSGGEGAPILGYEKAIIRHIAFEAYESLNAKLIREIGNRG